MEQKWIDWFLNDIADKTFTNLKRRHCDYDFYNYHKDSVPFHAEFNQFLVNLVNDDNFHYDIYHIHRWKEGSYFNRHNDDKANRKFAYVHELQESECKTKLLVEDKDSEYGWFDAYTYHSVPKIQKGVRISLTVFGKKIIKKGLI